MNPGVVLERYREDYPDCDWRFRAGRMTEEILRRTDYANDCDIELQELLKERIKLREENEALREALEDIEAQRGDGLPGNAVIATSAPGLMRRAERVLAKYPRNIPSQLVSKE